MGKNSCYKKNSTKSQLTAVVVVVAVEKGEQTGHPVFVADATTPKWVAAAVFRADASVPSRGADESPDVNEFQAVDFSVNSTRKCSCSHQG